MSDIRRLNTLSRVGKLGKTFYEELRQAPTRGRKVVWVGGYTTPVLLFRAMDMDYMYTEAYSATLTATHQEKPSLALSEAEGYSADYCSYGRICTGSLLMSEEEKAKSDPMYLVPDPDCVFVVNNGCPILVYWFDYIRKHFNAPSFALDIPFVWDRTEEQDVIRETEIQFKEAVVFLEDIAKRKLDWERLQEIVAEVKRTMTIRMEAQDLAGSAIPSPATFFDWSIALGAPNHSIGTPLCTEIYEQLRDELKERIARGEGALVDEKCRLFWYGVQLWPHIGTISKMLAGMGANVLASFYTHRTFCHRPDLLNPEKPLESLAANTILWANYNFEQVAEDLIDMCRKYSIDGLVCHYARTCPLFSRYYFEMADAVSQALGIPSIHFEGDLADSEFFSPNRFETQIQTLVETILSKKH